MKKKHKETVLAHFSNLYLSNPKSFLLLFGILENSARNTIQNGWEKRLLINMEYVRRKDRALYDLIIDASKPKVDEPKDEKIIYLEDYKRGAAHAI